MIDMTSRYNELLETITRAHTEFLDLDNPVLVFENFLEVLLSLTDSEYGFVGEVLQKASNEPYLKTYAITNISWNDDTRRMYEDTVAEGMEFTNLNTLFGQVMVTEKPVISNQPATDPRRGGLPEGHPALNAFLGIPIISNGVLVGMAGLGNRPEGYDQEMIDFLQPLLLTCGTLIRMIRDEHKQKEITNALLASENRARAVLASTHDAIITINDNGIIDTVNPAIENLFGYAPKELIGRNVKLLMPEPHRSQHDNFLSRYLKTGDAKIIGIGREVVAQRKDGSRFPIDLAITEVSVPGHHLFTGIVRDISARKIAQARVEETLAELAQNNEDMLAILNQTRMGVVMIDADGIVRFVSRTCEILLQTHQESLLGLAWEEACPFNADQKRELRALFSEQDESRKRLTAKLVLGHGREFWSDIEIRDDPRNTDAKILFLYDMTEVHDLRSRLKTATGRQMVGNSKAMREMFELFDKFAPGDWTVMIEGETGVGKELIASGLHASSNRSDKPFIAVNCGGLTESLLTSQLFGHRRGAFTGAVTDQEGVFEAANGGTIFLDEIAEVPMAAQASLLRVLQEREVVRVGEVKPRRIDVRILAATNRDLAEDVAAGRFREDLLYRIRVARIRVPPLRERFQDVPLLIAAFLAEHRLSTHKPVNGVEPAALERLIAYSWPGNVRELKNVIEIAAITCSSQEIRVSDLPVEIQSAPEGPPVAAPAVAPESAPKILSSMGDPREELLEALRQARGQRTKAAGLLGISRATFYRRLQEHGLDAKTIRDFVRHS
jgi:PAS domain S-box-containing protein